MIRDVFAFVIALALLFFAARLATTLQYYRRARQRARDSERALGRTVIVDRWDVAIEAVNGTTLVECGAIRERVSQELARAVFDAVKRDVERRDRAATTPLREPRPGG
jgi:hypothetical protein